MNQFPEGTYCEVNRPLKRQKIKSGYKRTYTESFQTMLSKASTVGEIIRAYRKAGATYGIHSDMTTELFAKLDRAEKCKDEV